MFSWNDSWVPESAALVQFTPEQSHLDHCFRQFPKVTLVRFVNEFITYTPVPKSHTAKNTLRVWPIGKYWYGMLSATQVLIKN